MNTLKDLNEFDFVVRNWMAQKLKLKGNDLLAYACIYFFSRNETWFSCSFEDMANYINCTKRGARSNFKKLLDKGLIERRQVKYDDGIRIFQFRTIPNEHMPI